MAGEDLKIAQIVKDKDYGGGFVDSEKRYIIVDADGVIVDDAQGYGYKSPQAAHKAMWYRFKGGKDKIATANAVGKRYWSDKKKLADALEKCAEYNFKELARGETTVEEIVLEVEKDFGVTLDRRMVDWLMKQ
jgi:hypothetical protein